VTVMYSLPPAVDAGHGTCAMASPSLGYGFCVVRWHPDGERPT